MSEIEKKIIQKKKQLKLIWINLKKIMKFNSLIIQYLRIKLKNNSIKIKNQRKNK